VVIFTMWVIWVENFYRKNNSIIWKFIRCAHEIASLSWKCENLKMWKCGNVEM
jgi:hypothetical protein